MRSAHNADGYYFLVFSAYSNNTLLLNTQVILQRSLHARRLFSAVPAGLLIGILVEHAPGTGGEIASAILQGLSAGIFLHVTFQDFLPTEFSNSQDRTLKVLFVALGFGIIAIVTFFLC